MGIVKMRLQSRCSVELLLLLLLPGVVCSSGSWGLLCAVWRLAELLGLQVLLKLVVELLWRLLPDLV